MHLKSIKEANDFGFQALDTSKVNERFFSHLDIKNSASFTRAANATVRLYSMITIFSWQIQAKVPEIFGTGAS